MAAYLAGGFGVSLIVGAMVLFVLEGMGWPSPRFTPLHRNWGGRFALVCAVVVGGGVVGRVRSGCGGGAARGGAAETGAGEASRSIERLPDSRSCRSLFRTRCWASPRGWPALLVSRSDPERVLPGGDSRHLAQMPGYGTSIAALVLQRHCVHTELRFL